MGKQQNVGGLWPQCPTIEAIFVMFFGGLGYLAYAQGEVGLSKGMVGVGAFFLFVLGSSILRARKWQKRR
ncbi:MAG: hypothetical protein WHX52_04055 [Anaerolineae bacterium]